MEWSISRYETMPPMDNGDIPTDFDLLHPSTALGALAAAAARLRDIPELSGGCARRHVKSLHPIVKMIALTLFSHPQLSPTCWPTRVKSSGSCWLRLR